MTEDDVKICSLEFIEEEDYRSLAVIADEIKCIEYRGCILDRYIISDLK